MFRRFINLLKQDTKVAIRNYFHIVILVLITLMTLFINLVIPKQVKLTPTELFVDKTEGKVFEKYLINEGIDKDRIYESREALIEAMENRDNTLGIIVQGNLSKPKITVINQGTESTEILNLLDATLENVLDILRGTVRYKNTTIEYLRTKAEPVSFNKNIVPIMLMTEAVMLGFLLIAVMVFQEKEEGSIRAYRVSPGMTLEYILSKAVVNVVLALVYSVLLVLFTVGIKVNYFALITLIILASFFITMLGLAISVFFKNLQEFLFVGVFIMALLGFPSATYLSPSFAPSWITWIPSYSVLFGLREILFPTGKGDFLVHLNLILLVETLIFLIISYAAVNKKLMKEGR